MIRRDTEDRLTAIVPHDDGPHLEDGEPDVELAETGVVPPVACARDGRERVSDRVQNATRLLKPCSIMRGRRTWRDIVARWDGSITSKREGQRPRRPIRTRGPRLGLRASARRQPTEIDEGRLTGRLD